MHIAKQMMAEFGKQLVGKTVITMPMGLWPGGACHPSMKKMVYYSLVSLSFAI